MLIWGYGDWELAWMTQIDTLPRESGVPFGFLVSLIEELGKKMDSEI